MPTKTPTKPKEPITPAAEVLPPEATESPAVVPPEELDDTQEILTKHIRCTDTGIIVEGDLPLEKWAKGFEFFQKIGSKTQWWRGDMLVYGERKYGESYAQAVDIHGKSESRLQTYVYVALKFPIERRRPELSFDHHAEAASLDPRDADALLLRAIRERWTKMDVREEVAKINERNGVPKRGRKPGSTAAKVAASGKTPQVPEDEKPLIWNGYPLSTLNRELYQGPERLPAEEAERAAHHHKFPHKEALMNWLEEHEFTRKEGDEPCATPQSTNADASELRATAPESTQSTAPSTVASNGASVVQPDAAPQFTPEGLPVNMDEPCGHCTFKRSEHRAIDDACPDNALCNRNTTFSPAAPAAPPTPSDTVAATVTPLKPEDDPKFDIMPSMRAELATLRELYETEAKVAMEAVDAMNRAIVERDDAREQLKRYDVHTDTQTPLERAEAAILAFNTASAEVNEEEWKTIGENKLLRPKWLNRLLAQADIVIDKIQGHTPAPRK